MSPVALITERAGAFGAVAINSNSRGDVFDVPVRMVDGRTVAYRIRVEADDGTVTAKEDSQDKLPLFCPERHINSDGSFCLGWSGHTSLAVNDVESAEKWWARVLRFLTSQQMAKRSGVWPLEGAWAHGAAAEHQARAEAAAAQLGGDFLADLTGGKLDTKWSKGTFGSHGRALRVQRNGSDIYSIWVKPYQLINKRQACICGRGDIKRHRRLRSCGEHAEAALALASSLLEWKNAEEHFWKSMRHHQCCGTMKNCPLRAPAVGEVN